MPVSKKELIEALDEVLNKKRVIDDDTHKLHHQFIEMELEKRENRKLLIDKFRLSFVGGVALALLGFLVWAGKEFINFFLHGNIH